MREIKFRAWQIGQNTMIPFEKIEYLDLLDSQINIRITWDEDEAMEETLTLPLVDFELMQYTGSKDKNAVEIYDGDILHVFEKGQYGGKYNVAVQWIDHDDRFTVDPTGKQWSFWGCQCMSAKEISHHESVGTLFTRGFLTRRFGACIQLCEMTDRDGFDIEIIGNIYANPELIKEPTT